MKLENTKCSSVLLKFEKRRSLNPRLKMAACDTGGEGEMPDVQKRDSVFSIPHKWKCSVTAKPCYDLQRLTSF